MLQITMQNMPTRSTRVLSISLVVLIVSYLISIEWNRMDSLRETISKAQIVAIRNEYTQYDCDIPHTWEKENATLFGEMCGEKKYRLKSISKDSIGIYDCLRTDIFYLKEWISNTTVPLLGLLTRTDTKPVIETETAIMSVEDGMFALFFKDGRTEIRQPFLLVFLAHGPIIDCCYGSDPRSLPVHRLPNGTMGKSRRRKKDEKLPRDKRFRQS